MSDLHRDIILFCLITPPCLSGSALRAQVKPTGVEVEMVQSVEVKLPAEFQVALYENLVQQLREKGKFEHVYRDGDRNAAERPGTVVLHSSVEGFKQGSERERQVTTVAGATSIRVHCLFSDMEGHTLLERDIKGKVVSLAGTSKPPPTSRRRPPALLRELPFQQIQKQLTEERFSINRRRRQCADCQCCGDCQCFDWSHSFSATELP